MVSTKLVGSLWLLGALCACSGADEAAVSGDEEELIQKTPCPTAKASSLKALKAVAAQAQACQSAPPATPDTSRDWNHTSSSLLSATSSSHHRGRDAIYAEGEDQWILGKFTYGLVDKDLKGEEIDLYLQRGCQGDWEKLELSQPALTTLEAEHETVEGVEDTGGRVFVRIPEAQRLGIGHHRVRMVVAGDQSFADQEIEVLPRGTPLFLSDIDGTLTERREGDPEFVCDEESDFTALWDSLLDSGIQPAVHPGAAPLFQRLASLGYRPVYLTARPEQLAPHTRAFLKEDNRQDGRGDLPGGIVHTTLGLTGAFNSAAQAFKTDEVERLIAKGFKPVFGFGNRPSDVATYSDTGVLFGYYIENPDTRLRTCSAVTDLPLSPAGPMQKGHWRIQSYGSLQPRVDKLPPVCK